MTPSIHVSTQTRESRSAHFTQYKQLSLNQNRFTMHKKSSIDCKLFAINDLAGHSPPCLKNGHSCSDCRHHPVCLKTAQPTSFSSPRCLLFSSERLRRSLGGISPYISPKIYRFRRLHNVSSRSAKLSLNLFTQPQKALPR